MRILIVDDHEVVRRGVRSLLEGENGFTVCGEAVDGRDAIGKTRELNPDAIVMDISMPILNGLQAAREIRRIRPHTKVLILSQHDIPEMKKQALNAGASGYVVKTAMSRELVAALEKVKDGNSFFKDMPDAAQANIDLQEILQRSMVFERALRESDERLRLAQQVARVGTFELNVRTGVNHWTPELESLYGLRPGTFPSSQSAWEQLIHPEDRQSTVDSLNRLADVGGWEGEWRVIWPDGSVHWLLGRAWLFKDEAGNSERLVGANIDITDRKRSEERAERESRLLDLSFDAIVVRDKDDRIQYWNGGARELYGWSAEEASGEVTHKLLGTVFPEALTSILDRLKKEGRWEGELTHVCKDGKRITVMSRWAPFRDWESGDQWVLETNTDITARKAAEGELRKAVQVLEQQVSKRKQRSGQAAERALRKAAAQSC